MEYIIDKAPGKELILKLKETGEFAYLVELFCFGQIGVAAIH